MRSLKPIFGVIAALLPIVYCGWLLYYFLDLSGSVQEAVAEGLGPTLVGLSVVGLLFCILLIVRIIRIFAKRRSPGSGGPRSPGQTDPRRRGWVRRRCSDCPLSGAAIHGGRRRLPGCASRT